MVLDTFMCKIKMDRTTHHLVFFASWLKLPCNQPFMLLEIHKMNRLNNSMSNVVTVEKVRNSHFELHRVLLPNICPPNLIKSTSIVVFPLADDKSTRGGLNDVAKT